MRLRAARRFQVKDPATGETDIRQGHAAFRFGVHAAAHKPGNAALRSEGNRRGVGGRERILSHRRRFQGQKDLVGNLPTGFCGLP